LVFVAGWAAPVEASCQEVNKRTSPLTISAEHAALMTLLDLTHRTLALKIRAAPERAVRASA
jgi:hypothetical protein